LVRILIVISAIVAAEGALVAVSLPSVGGQFRSSLGILLVLTGCVVLGGTLLTSGGRRPMRFPGSRGVLVSSGTQALWDINQNPEQDANPSKIFAGLGIGSGLFVLGLVLGLV